jgi:hypothetical protein
MQDVPTEPITIRFLGFASKKNFWRPGKNGRGIYLDKKTRALVERMELQVPAEVRDLRLESPDMIWTFRYTNGHADRDGIMVTVLDILQKYGVLVNDSITRCNGLWTVHPAERGEYDEVEVTLIPREPRVPH